MKNQKHPKMNNGWRFAHLRGAFLFFGMTLAILLFYQQVAAQSRIKDIVEFEGIRENQLIGYGLVVGLNGTGDSLTNSVFTRETLVGMLGRLGVNANDDALSTDNIAAVTVTGSLPAFARQGTRMDVTISSLGNASSLLGGTLLVTPLLGADGEVYAVAQGTLAVGGLTAQGQAETLIKGVPTSARIANGAIIEREIPYSLTQKNQIKLALRNPDLTTARRISRAINAFIGEPIALVTDPGTIDMRLPPAYDAPIVELLTDIEQLRVEPDVEAKVVIDEQSGIIVMGENVRINRVAVAQGNLIIRITEMPEVRLPEAFTNSNEVAIEPRTEITVDENADKKMAVFNSGVSLQELVNGLNALGVGPRDMITILQTIKAAGALQAKIEVI